MFEIPISLRYDFAHSARNGFFITGGMSSYLMKQQNYTALVSNSSMQWPASFSFTDQSSNYFFSIYSAEVADMNLLLMEIIKSGSNPI